METNRCSCTAILKVLDECNYMDWSVRVKTYLISKDLWDAIEDIQPPKDDETIFKVWSKKNSKALYVIQNSCGSNTFSEIREISSAKIAWHTLAEKYNLVEVDLQGYNYAEWSAQVKSYLTARDMWDIIEQTVEPPNQEDDGATFKAWNKKNSMALYVIQNSCEAKVFSEIREISSAKMVWETLARMYNAPKKIGSVVREVLDRKNYMDWSVRVKTYLVALDLWNIVEATTGPPRYEDDEAGFMAWNKKDSFVLQVIQNSCEPDILAEIQEISSAKITWKTLAEKYNTIATTDAGLSPEMYNTTTTTDAGSCDVGTYAALYKAVRSGDWDAVNEFLQDRPNAVRAQITTRGETALHIAVDNGHLSIVERLVDLMQEEDLEIRDNFGHETALIRASAQGRYRMAKCMVSKNMKLVTIGNSNGDLPVSTALFFGQIKTARYLYSLTPPEYLMPERGHNGTMVFIEAIYTGTLDIALDLMERCPRLAFTPAYKLGGLSSPILALASMPNAFPSANRRHVFYKRWIYSGIHIRSSGHAKNETRLNISKAEIRQSDQQRTFGSVLSALLCHQLSSIRSFLGIEHLYKEKLIHVQSQQLLLRICEEIANLTHEQRKNGGVYHAISAAATNGIFEIFFEMLRIYPDLLWTYSGDREVNIFSLSVLHRQAKIFSLMYGLHDVKNALTCREDKDKNTMLHMAGMSIGATMLTRIPGPALQMQRELQWFKEVESVVHPKVKEARNKEGLTPREVFTKDHKDMIENGEKWMKDTSTSCTVVGALILTIMFAAAFTVPGGNNQTTGLPVFLNDKYFRLFIIADALSLFSSSTSVLMFLGILTSRYAEDDFLESLPRKMIIGLSTLFFSIAAMMIAFYAALSLMLHGLSSITFPVICLAGIPVTLFVLLQFPLLVEMVVSTYGPGIFNKKMKPLFRD